MKGVVLTRKLLVGLQRLARSLGATGTSKRDQMTSGGGRRAIVAGDPGNVQPNSQFTFQPYPIHSLAYFSLCKNAIPHSTRLPTNHRNRSDSPDSLSSSIRSVGTVPQTESHALQGEQSAGAGCSWTTVREMADTDAVPR